MLSSSRSKCGVPPAPHSAQASRRARGAPSMRGAGGGSLGAPQGGGLGAVSLGLGAGSASGSQPQLGESGGHWPARGVSPLPRRSPPPGRSRGQNPSLLDLSVGQRPPPGRLGGAASGLEVSVPAGCRAAPAPAFTEGCPERRAQRSGKSMRQSGLLMG